MTTQRLNELASTLASSIAGKEPQDVLNLCQTFIELAVKEAEETIHSMPKGEMSAAKCYDCGLDYSAFGLDLILPDQQWKWLFPEFEGSGLLCPTCICKRAECLGGSTVVLAWIDCITWSAPRPEEWFDKMEGKHENNS